jgi:hypothetical protein
MSKNVPWRDAIVEVMSHAKASMHYTEVADAIIEQKLREDVGATPANTVARFISEDINANAEKSVFVRTERGHYMLRDAVSGVPTPEEKDDNDGPDGGAGLINAFGMYWRRDLVHWSKGVSLFGKQPGADATVDFSPQHGIYLLHDHRGVVYVGRTTDQALGNRLFQHTSDRLNGRWDRFSWFGVYAVKEDGSLQISPDTTHAENACITAMEAILIEGLEPPQNRKRGDDFGGVEYLQVEDPKLKEIKVSKIIDEIKSKLT